MGVAVWRWTRAAGCRNRSSALWRRPGSIPCACVRACPGARAAAGCDADWDREIAQLDRLSPEQFVQGLKGDFTLRWLIAIAPRYAGMLVPPRLRKGAGRVADRITELGS